MKYEYLHPADSILIIDAFSVGGTAEALFKLAIMTCAKVLRCTLRR